MAKAVKKETVTITHPRTGSQFRVESGIYEPVRAAILQSLKGSQGMTFTDLIDQVVPIVKKKLPGFRGSIPWYTISIRLDLESRGIVETFSEKGKKLNRLAK